jgi:quercetin dioxygenase-like cupin family protein
MTHKEYVEAVARGEWPVSPRVPVPTPDFEDTRGQIFNLLLLDVASVSQIYSHRGTVRANHWHKEDWHFALVLKGEVGYFERPVGDTGIPVGNIFGPGEMFFTPPGREHAMIFTEDTSLLTFSRRRRDHASHEEDVVRVDFVPPALIAALLK